MGATWWNINEFDKYSKPNYGIWCSSKDPNLSSHLLIGRKMKYMWMPSLFFFSCLMPGRVQWLTWKIAKARKVEALRNGSLRLATRGSACVGPTLWDLFCTLVSAITLVLSVSTFLSPGHTLPWSADTDAGLLSPFEMRHPARFTTF